ncbi:MAG: NAD-dependent epimerase/dehydratase family protein [Endomicrobia bacterium]|nr:NAD-dependent epimerase/dehydratase family protein [Endomicrobiia bacterium]
MRILITGANGFIGSHLVTSLFDNDYSLRILIRKTSNIERIKEIIDKVEVFYGDIRSKECLVEALKDVDVVIHTAAVLRCIDINTYYEVNYVGTKNLVDAMLENIKNNNIKGIIYFSSLAASGPSKKFFPKKVDDEVPVSHYGASKLLAEKEILRCKDILKTIILRPSAVYGPYDKDMFLYFKMAEKGVLPYFVDNFYIQFTYIFDIVKITNEILKNFHKFFYNKFFIAEPKVYSVREICNVLSNTINKKVRPLKIPYEIGYAYSLINEFLYNFLYKKPAVFNRDKLKELSYSYWICCSEEILEYIKNFSYTQFDKGSAETYRWYLTSGWL